MPDVSAVGSGLQGEYKGDSGKIRLCMRCMNRGHWSRFPDVRYVVMTTDCECTCHQTERDEKQRRL